MWLLQSGSNRCTAGRRATGLVKAGLRTQLGLDIFNLKMEEKIKVKPGCTNSTNLKIYRTKPKWLQSVWKVSDTSVVFTCFHCLLMEKTILMGLFLYQGFRYHVQAPALGSERPPRARRPWRPQHDQHLQLEEVPKSLRRAKLHGKKSCKKRIKSARFKICKSLSKSLPFCPVVPDFEFNSVAYTMNQYDIIATHITEPESVSLSSPELGIRGCRVSLRLS